MDTMLAAVLHRAGGPHAFALETVPVPVPGPGDVLVKVEACGVSYRDVVERNGTYRRDVTFPLVIGLEISGTVVETGGEVADLAVGQHVCTKAFSSCGHCEFCRTGRETTCFSRRPVRGGYAQYVCLPQDAFVPVPDGLTFEQSCALGPGAGVALNAVRDTAAVRIGETVLVTGATGGVGAPAVQIARAAGARVLAATRDQAKTRFLKDLGASEVIVASGPDLIAAVRELTGGRGVDVVVDTVGSRVFEAAFDSLAVHGRYALVGQLFGEESTINLARIFFKRAAILGVGSVSRKQLADTIDLALRGVIIPRISRVLPLHEVAEAHRLVEGGAVAGRVVLKP